VNLPPWSKSSDGEPPDSGVPALDLSVLIASLSANLAALERAVIRPPLLLARLSDRLRDEGVDPPEPGNVNAWVSRMDAHGWRRLALLVAALDVDAVRALLAPLARRDGVERVVRVGILDAAVEASLLTLVLLRESNVRLEELARRWMAALGVAIAGETPAVSGERLRRVDYARLLREAERAKAAAEDRMAELRKQQELAEQMRAGRSKW
jgi:hypothetical protein